MLGFDKRKDNTIFDVSQPGGQPVLVMKQSKVQFRAITDVFDSNEAGK